MGNNKSALSYARVSCSTHSWTSASRSHAFYIDSIPPLLTTEYVWPDLGLVGSLSLQMASNTRSLSIIAHVDHGKTTLSDSFLSRARVLADDKAGTALTLDFGKEEQERGITIKSMLFSIYMVCPDLSQAPASR